MTDKITIIAENQTASDVSIDQLGVVVPASGAYTLSNTLDLFQIYESDELQTLIDAGTILLNNGTSTLNQGDSTNYVGVFNTDEMFDYVNENRIYGTEPQLFENTSQTTNSTTSYVDQINTSTPVIPAGKYKILFRTGWRSSSASFPVQLRLTINGTDVISNLVAPYSLYFSDHYFVDQASSQAMTVQVSFKASSAGVITNVYNTYVEIIRIS